jgi:hypothetical protein
MMQWSNAVPLRQKTHETHLGGDMNTLALAKTAVAVLGLVFVAGADVATAKQKQECFTEDGFGRKRSCVQGYRARRVEQTRDNCFSDDAYGRRRPCAANFRRKR